MNLNDQDFTSNYAWWGQIEVISRLFYFLSFPIIFSIMSLYMEGSTLLSDCVGAKAMLGTQNSFSFMFLYIDYKYKLRQHVTFHRVVVEQGTQDFPSRISTTLKYLTQYMIGSMELPRKSSLSLMFLYNVQNDAGFVG